MRLDVGNQQRAQLVGDLRAFAEPLLEARHGLMQQHAETVDGLGMLLHQAVPGFEKWFGVRPEVTGELRDLLVADIEGK